MITLNVQEDSILLHTEPAIVVGETSTVDAIPLEDSPNAVSSGGVYAAIGASDHVKAQNVRFDDGESFQTKLENGSLNGSAGERGPAGKDGHTPIRGTDYWTEADKQEIVEEVLAQGGGESGSYEQFDARNFSGGSLTTREGYYAYRDNGTNFTYTMPYPQQGAVTITFRFERDEAHTGKETGIDFVYNDGTTVSQGRFSPDVTHTIVSDAGKTLTAVKGDWNMEQLVYLDLSVMSIVSDYAVPDIMVGATATTAGRHGFVPAPAAGDQDKALFGDGKWKELPETAAGGDFIPSPASAVVGQTIKVSAVDANSKPTAWEAVDFPGGGAGALTWELVGEVTVTEDSPVTKVEFTDLPNYTQMVIYIKASSMVTSTHGLCAYVNDMFGCALQNADNSTQKVVLLLLEGWHGLYAESSYGTYGNRPANMANGVDDSYYAISKEPAQKITIRNPYNSGQIKAGTFTIYGGR